MLAMLLLSILLALAPAPAPQTYPPEVQKWLWPELTRFWTPDALTDSVFGRAQRPRGRPKLVRWHFGAKEDVWESLTVEYDEDGRLEGWLKSGQMMDPSGRSAERDDEARIVVTRMDWSTSKATSSGYHWTYGPDDFPLSAKFLVNGRGEDSIRFDYEDGRVRRRLEREDGSPGPLRAPGAPRAWKTKADYRHNADGRLVLILSYVHGSTVHRHFDYDGLDVRRITVSVDGTTVEIVDYERDGAGRVRIERATRLTGPRQGVESKLYSEAGTLALERFCKGDGETGEGESRVLRPCSTRGSTTTYYADGDLLCSISIDSKGVEHRVDYELAFDGHGNWIRSMPIHSRPGPPDDADTVWRGIEYYD